MENFKTYQIEKDKLLSKIQLIKDKLKELSEIGIDCDEEIEKLEKVITTIDKDIINVVLVGSISDGKTSLIAGWLGEEKPDMKIDRDESSDEILFYKSKNLPDYCKLIDTPGLFGSKEDTKAEIKLSDKTKKFIDEATILIYVVEAGNPVKDSHKEILKWILTDLGKLDNTIFVINKMDNVIDITDEESFRTMATTKQTSLKKKLHEELGIRNEDIEKLHIICLSSDPKMKGIEHWAKKREEYEKCSRINDLSEEVNNILQDSTVSSLVTKTGYDVISRIVDEKLVETQNQIEIIDELLPELEESLRRQEKDFKHAKEQILKVGPKLISKLIDSREKLIRQLNQTTPEDIYEFVQLNLGIIDGQIDYHIIEEQLYLISSEYFSQTNGYLVNLQKKLDYDATRQEKVCEKIMKKGSKGASNALKAAGKLPAGQVKAAVFAVRDAINKIFGTAIKFKPWQAVKIAKVVSKAAPIAGAAVDVISEVIEAFKRNKQLKEFEKFKSERSNDIEKIYETVISEIRDEEKFLNKFAPQLKEVKDVIRISEETIEHNKRLRDAFRQWKKNTVDVDFKVN